MATNSIVRVPGDYILTAKSGGIVLDVSSTSTIYAANPGTVTIYGNLDVIGSSTTVESTNTNITDNIIFLNGGETNNYVTKGYSGIAISRGSVSTLTNAAYLLFNDTRYWAYDNVLSFRGVWELATAAGAQNFYGTALQVSAIRIDAGTNFLNFLGKENPLAMLNVRGTTNYEQQVLDDDDIPNKKYVDDRFFVGNELARKLKVGNTFVEINDNSVVPSDPYYSATNRIKAVLGTSTNVVFQLEGTSALVQGLTISDTNISVNAGRFTENMTISAVGTGTVRVNGPIGLRYSGGQEAILNHTHVYSTSTVGGGGTGLFFVNTARQDELVSRKRAIIYGIIF